MQLGRPGKLLNVVPQCHVEISLISFLCKDCWPTCGKDDLPKLPNEDENNKRMHILTTWPPHAQEVESGTPYAWMLDSTLL